MEKMNKGKIQVELQEWMGSDLSIANAAWTSTYDKDRREHKYDDAQKVGDLVRRLIREGHSTPVESVVLRFWIRMPIFTDRQHMTHRIASHNGLSGRYRTMPSDWLDLPDDVALICAKASDMETGAVRMGYNSMLAQQRNYYDAVLASLKEGEVNGKITNTEYKRAREVFRGILGTSFMVERTTIFNLRSFANYQRLRNSDHAQPEIKEVARLMLEQVKSMSIAPIAVATLEEIGWRI